MESIRQEINSTLSMIKSFFELTDSSQKAFTGSLNYLKNEYYNLLSTDEIETIEKMLAVLSIMKSVILQGDGYMPKDIESNTVPVNAGIEDLPRLTKREDKTLSNEISKILGYTTYKKK